MFTYPKIVCYLPFLTLFQMPRRDQLKRQHACSRFPRYGGEVMNGLIEVVIEDWDAYREVTHTTKVGRAGVTPRTGEFFRRV